MEKGAAFSEDRDYRYLLFRIWNEEKPVLPVIMLNPSTADHRVDDPTIRRVIGFARSWGYGGISVGNLMAYRATNPKNLPEGEAAIGPKNKAFLETLIQEAPEFVLCAWGVNDNRGMDKWVKDLAGAMGKPLKSLGRTKEGHPRHPLYVHSGQRLEDWG